VACAIRLDLAYEGTAYHGFSLQPGRCTVQGVLEQELSRLLGHPVRLTAAGRTDAGVHARGQVVSFETTATLPAEAVARALRNRLPEDVLALRSSAAAPGFDARRQARSRYYRYTIWRDEQPDLFWRRFSWPIAGPLDEQAMRVASEALLGRHDFSSFVGHAAQDPAHATSIRTMLRAQWRREGELLHFDCQADGFARHMVRNIVGTLVEVGRRKRQPGQIGQLMANADRRLAGPTAPARGLTLMRVAYGSAPDESNDDRESGT
jgi:tRNA pseudouridine38-40 synthase